jgi:hypothetical protein
MNDISVYRWWCVVENLSFFLLQQLAALNYQQEKIFRLEKPLIPGKSR